MNKPPGASLLGALVRVTRFERAISTSQMWRGTSSATPGYSVLSYYTTPQVKIKDFPVCGHSCGQGRFSARFGDPAKWRKRPCCKAFRASAFLVVDGAGSTPKAGALPTAQHPDIEEAGNNNGIAHGAPIIPPEILNLIILNSVRNSKT